MNVITVIPMSRGIGKETLSYFTAEKVDLGSLVEVPLRKKYVSALVVEIRDARSMKTELRQADFSLRKVEKLISKPFLSESFMKTVEETARFHAATVGATLNVLLPKKIGKIGSGTYFNLPEKKAKKGVPKGVSKMVPDPIYLNTFTKRIEYYKQQISTYENTVIIVPTKERQDVLKKLIDIPILLPTSLVEIPLDTAMIIIEDITSTAYKGISRPFIDFRFVIEHFASHIGATLLKGADALDPHIKKVLEEHKKQEDKPYSSIGANLERDIKLLKGAPGHLFILGIRKGHSGTVLCQDCGHTFRCNRCEAPLTLHTKSIKEDFNSMLCHHCGYKTSAMTGCPVCSGWRLKAYGLGIEKIEEDINALCRKYNIKAYVQRIDSTLRLTPKKIRDFIKTHYHKDRAILIGTELMLPHLVHATTEDRRNDASYIASLDTLLSLPDFSINEKVWRLCAELDDISKEKVVIQTRSTDHPLLTAWKKGDAESFWQKELEERKKFNYPPHGVIIKITLKGRKEKIATEMKQIAASLAEWKPMVFPAFIKTINNMHILHALLVVPKDEWVNNELLSILRSLPLSTIIEVNPRSLL